MYDMPDEIQIAADGPIRIITLNRPDNLNAVNDALHTGLARLWGRLSEDYDARAAVITGAGRAFSAGGDFAYLEELSPVRRRVHGDERLPLRSARVDRAGRRRRRAAGLAAADQLAVGQGVRVHRREDPRRAGAGNGPGQPRCRGPRIGGPRVRQADRRPAPPGGRGDQAHLEHPTGARRPGHHRLRHQRRRGHLLK